MRFSHLLSALSLLTSVFGDGGSDVIDLTAKNFDEIVKPEALMLVEFFAPW